MSRQQAQLLARRFKYRAPAYISSDRRIKSACSIVNTDESVVVYANGYVSDMRKALAYAKSNIPNVITFRYKELGHWRRVVCGAIPV